VGDWSPASISVVAPVFDEEPNVAPLVRGIAAAVRPLGVPFEIVVVDDGSRDGTLAALRRLLPEVPELVVVALRRNVGQTLALQAGFDRARGHAIVTLDGDLQNDPNDIPRLVERLAQGADVVSGWRKDRKDTLVVRKLPSWIANRLIRRVTGVTIHDQGCSLKAYRRSIVRGLDLYSDMHRFITVLTMAMGATIEELEVRHHARVAGTSKYGLSRVVKVIADLFVIQMLTRFRESPLRWFGLVGLPFGLLAAASAALSALLDDPSLVLPTTALLAGTTFTACLIFGLLGELVIETAGAGRHRPVAVREWGTIA
jgi:glycosyltransferase involved in cell wall biosynthesis